MRLQPSLILWFSVMAAIWPLEASAASLALSSCSGGVPNHQIVTAIVTCVQTAVSSAAGTIFGLLAGWMFPIVGGMFTIATTLMGIRLASGEQGAARQMVPFAIKLSILSGYVYMLADIGGLAFNLMTNLAALAGGGATPWGLIDNFLKTLLGYGPSLKLYQGLLGLIVASLFSGTIGVVVFLAGALAVLSLLRCIGRIIFMYLGAFVVVGFMVGISPIFIPMLVFNVTDRYFKQWLNITLAAIIQPMLLFAVCSMFLGIIPGLISNVYSVTGGNDFRPIWRWNKPLISWLTPSDPKLQTQILDVVDQPVPIDPTAVTRTRTPAVPSYFNPLLADAPNVSMYRVPAIDFGLFHISKMQQLLTAFVALALFCMMMKTLVEIIPGIAEDITGSAVGLSGMRTSIENMGDKALANMRSTLDDKLKPPEKKPKAQDAKKGSGDAKKQGKASP